MSGIKINYLAPATTGRLAAEARVVERTTRIGCSTPASTPKTTA